MEYLVKLLVAGFFILLALHFLRPRAAFRITVRGERIAVTGLLPGGKGAEVVSFFRQELPEVSRARVEGYWQGRRLRLRFSRGLSAGQQQRIRNFLSFTL
jgi:hypothetical protein